MHKSDQGEVTFELDGYLMAYHKYNLIKANDDVCFLNQLEKS